MFHLSTRARPTIEMFLHFPDMSRSRPGKSGSTVNSPGIFQVLINYICRVVFAEISWENVHIYPRVAPLNFSSIKPRCRFNGCNRLRCSVCFRLRLFISIHQIKWQHETQTLSSQSIQWCNLCSHISWPRYPSSTLHATKRGIMPCLYSRQKVFPESQRRAQYLSYRQVPILSSIKHHPAPRHLH